MQFRNKACLKHSQQKRLKCVLYYFCYSYVFLYYSCDYFNNIDFFLQNISRVKSLKFRVESSHFVVRVESFSFSSRVESFLQVVRVESKSSLESWKTWLESESSRVIRVESLQVCYLPQYKLCYLTCMITYHSFDIF